MFCEAYKAGRDNTHCINIHNLLSCAYYVMVHVPYSDIAPYVGRITVVSIARHSWV